VNAPSYRRCSDVLWRRALDAVLVLPPGAAEPITLAATGPEVWELLETPHSLAELAGKLSVAHQVDPDVVAADVGPVLERLGALGLIEPVL
jgi:Coenzyme PQQ synthesis protein D (PqqD)